MRKILLATDGSPTAASATKEAIALARETRAALHIVTAWTIPVSGFGPAAIAVTNELAEGIHGQARQALAAAVEAAEEAGLAPTAILRRGFAAEQICDTAAEIGADVIVVGSHGWGVFKRALLGSVSARVLHDAPCPVLVVGAGRAGKAATGEDRQFEVVA